MIEIIVIFGLSIFSFYLFFNLMQFRKFGLLLLLKAIKKRKPILLLESPTNYFIEVPENQMENLMFTKKKDIIITPAGTVKNCPTLGNAQIGHADLYLSCAIPMDLLKFIEEKKKDGWDENKIAEELDRIVTSEKEGKKKAIPEQYATKNKQEWRVYKTYSVDNIKNFLNTGINRTLLKRQILTLIEQNKLSQMFGGRNWMAIVIPLAIIIIVIAVVLMMLSGSGFIPSVSEMVTPVASGAGRIAP